MHSFALPAIVLAAIAAIPAVNAHGYVSGIVAGGKYYPGADPGWVYNTQNMPKTAGWFAYNQDNGFVGPEEYTDPNITCHKGATPGNSVITVAAGSKIELEWSTWPDSHKGPIINYLARCNNGDCTKVDKTTLNFFKVQAAALVNPTPEPGTWVTDTMIGKNI